MAATQDNFPTDLTARIKTFSLATWCGMPYNVTSISFTLNS